MDMRGVGMNVHSRKQYTTCKYTRCPTLCVQAVSPLVVSLNIQSRVQPSENFVVSTDLKISKSAVSLGKCATIYYSLYGVIHTHKHTPDRGYTDAEAEGLIPTASVAIICGTWWW